MVSAELSPPPVKGRDLWIEGVMEEEGEGRKTEILGVFNVDVWK